MTNSPITNLGYWFDMVLYHFQGLRVVHGLSRRLVRQAGVDAERVLTLF